jgi:hypothetical protein
VFPEATQIVDLYHVRQHLHDLAGILEFMFGGQRDDWLAARLDDLDHGDIDGMCKAARVYPLVGTKKDELDTALGVLRAQRAPPHACMRADRPDVRNTPRAACTIVARRSAFIRRFRVPAAIGPALQPVSAVKAEGPPQGGGLQVAGQRRRGRSRRRVQQAGWHVGSFQGDEVAGVRHLGESGGGE